MTRPLALAATLACLAAPLAAQAPITRTELGRTGLEAVPGMVQHFERGIVHAGITNSGDASIRLMTVHIVDKGKPLNVPAE